MKYLVFIPARAGSKGIIEKNKVLLANKPLVEYTFDAACAATLVDAIHLSSNDADIIEMAGKRGIVSLYKRPEYLSEDTSSIFEALDYHITYLKSMEMALPEVIVLLQPTSPVRRNGLVDLCIEAFEQSGSKSLVAVSKCLNHPYETFQRKDGKNIFFGDANMQRQAYPECFFITGSIYIATLDFIFDNKKFFNQETALFEVSLPEAVDIDDEDDLYLAAYYLQKIKSI